MSTNQHTSNTSEASSCNLSQKVENLTKSHSGLKAGRDYTRDKKRGDFIIVRDNGAGKST